MNFSSFGENLKVIIIGSSGGIGAALVEHLVNSSQVAQIHAFSRSPQTHPSSKVTNLTLDFTNEDSLVSAAQTMQDAKPFDIIIVATGLLQGEGIAPEKTLCALTHDGFSKSFEVNSIGPAMAAKYFVPLLGRDSKAVFASLSARVGSISDNRLGGWYAYRAAKAALNMIIKTLAIEIARRFSNQIILTLHPGTVDTALSKPFQGNVPDGKLFTAEFSAERLLSVIDGAEPSDSGNLIDWAGKRVEF